MRRVRNPELIARSSQNIRGASSSALEAVRPLHFDREDFIAGYRGRHADGGRARFKKMVAEQKLSSEALRELRLYHLRLAALYSVAAWGALVYGLFVMFSADSMLAILGGASVSILFFAFMALCLRHDFSGWQIKVQRFGGFSEYLATRL